MQSKLSGVGQVFAVTFNTYPRPIPTPVHNLRPARETCEACHWPQKYGEDRVRVIPKFADDETNTPTKTVLLMKIGGGNNGHRHSRDAPGPGRAHPLRPLRRGPPEHSLGGIQQRRHGKTVVYADADAKPDGAGLTMREMDCMDCHNRPSHTYRPAGAGRGPRHGRRPDFGRAALRQEESRGDPEGRLRHRATRPPQQFPAAFAKYLPGQLSGRVGAARRPK